MIPRMVQAAAAAVVALVLQGPLTVAMVVMAVIMAAVVRVAVAHLYLARHQELVVLVLLVSSLSPIRRLQTKSRGLVLSSPEALLSRVLGQARQPAPLLLLHNLQL